jgi:hypothetical protein
MPQIIFQILKVLIFAGNECFHYCEKFVNIKNSIKNIKKKVIWIWRLEPIKFWKDKFYIVCLKSKLWKNGKIKNKKFENKIRLRKTHKINGSPNSWIPQIQERSKNRNVQNWILGCPTPCLTWDSGSLIGFLGVLSSYFIRLCPR